MTSSEHEPKGTETNHHTPEKKKGLTKTQKIGAVIAGVVLLGVGGLAYNIYNNGRNVISDKASDSSSQTTSPETTQISAYLKFIEKYDSITEKYRDIGIDAFETLPLDERLSYSQYLIDKTVINGNYDGTYGQGKVGQDFAVKPTTESLDSSGQDIINNYLYKTQVSYIQFIAGDYGSQKPYNKLDGEKILSSIYYGVGKNKTVSNDYLTTKADEETQAFPTALSNKLTVTDTSALVNSRNTDGEDIQYKVITYTHHEETIYSRFIYHEFTNYDGTHKSIWLLDTQSGALSELK